MAERRRTARIPVFGSDGQAHEVLEYSEFGDSTAQETRPGLKSYRLDTSQALKQLDADTWQTVDGSLTLRRAST